MQYRKIAILMATYNGARYLEQQIESILTQSERDWNLIIRDDHSTDGTREIIERYCSQDDRIIWLNDGNGKQGAKLNFGKLMEFAVDTYSYFMFCDQDDIWASEKISYSIKALQELEAQHGANVPLLVYTNFSFVGEDLSKLKRVADVAPFYSADEIFNTLFVTNVIYGCTVAINRSLVKLSIPIPADCENHDYWIAFVASALGHIRYLDQTTVLYRQHGRNVTSVYKSGTFRGRINKLLAGRDDRRRDWMYKVAHTKTLNDRFGAALPKEKKLLLDGFLERLSGRNISLIRYMIRNKMLRRTWMQSTVFYLQIALSRKPG